MLQSLRFRTAAAYVLLIVAAFAALGLYLLQKVETDFRDNIERDLGAQALMVESLARPLMERGASQPDFDLKEPFFLSTHLFAQTIGRHGLV